MEWNLSETMVLAMPKCAYCQGYGMRAGRRKNDEYPCDCVYRKVFRTCYKAFRRCVETEKRICTVSMERSFDSPGKGFYGRKIEEYIADFCVVSRRVLNPAQYLVFRYHFLLGAGCKPCCQALKMNQGTFFHRVYYIEKTLGRVFCELEPYSLFPLDAYFHGARLAPAAIVEKMPPRSARKGSPDSLLLKIA